MNRLIRQNNNICKQWGILVLIGCCYQPAAMAEPVSFFHLQDAELKGISWVTEQAISNVLSLSQTASPVTTQDLSQVYYDQHNIWLIEQTVYDQHQQQKQLKPIETMTKIVDPPQKFKTVEMGLSHHGNTVVIDTPEKVTIWVNPEAKQSSIQH